MTDVTVDIYLETRGGSLYLKFNRNGGLWAESSITVDEINAADENYIFHWMLNAGKKIFSQMPVAQILQLKASCTPELWARIGNTGNNFANIIMNTNRFLSENIHLKGKAAEHKKILFYNQGDNDRFLSFSRKCIEMDPERVLYRNMDVGWDKNARQWDESKASFMSLQDLVKFIVEENIRKIVTQNHYYADLVMGNDRINIVPVLHFMGIEFVMMDGDSYNDTAPGYICKASLTYDMNPHFSVFPYLDKSYDEKYGLKNVYYVPYPHDYEDVESCFEIEGDYSVVVLSNARFPAVVRYIYLILYLLDFLDGKRIFTELQLWWLSMRWIILHDTGINEVQQRNYESQLMEFFYSGCLSFLKYEIIDSIKTDRKVLLYGDPPWELLFPEYYQKKYLSTREKDELFSKKRALHLLMNFAYSYPEAHPTVNDALMRNVPFICHPALVKTAPYAGFRHIEYNDAAGLNGLIGDIGKSLNNVEFNTSVTNYKKLMKAGQSEMAENILFDRALPADGGLYLHECEQNNVILNEMIQAYIKEKEEFLKDTFRVFFLNESRAFDVTRTRYFGKRYVQRIIDYKKSQGRS